VTPRTAIEEECSGPLLAKRALRPNTQQHENDCALYRCISASVKISSAPSRRRHFGRATPPPNGREIRQAVTPASTTAPQECSRCNGHSTVPTVQYVVADGERYGRRRVAPGE
jgi:hypothetical protein